MKDLIGAAFLALICVGFWAAVPVFAIIAGTGMAILFLKYLIQESKNYDHEQENRPDQHQG
jgi:hypothetical protein